MRFQMSVRCWPCSHIHLTSRAISLAEPKPRCGRGASPPTPSPVPSASKSSGLAIRNPSIHQSINPSIHQSINPSIHQSINPPIHQSINPAIRQSINPSIHQSTPRPPALVPLPRLRLHPSPRHHQQNLPGRRCHPFPLDPPLGPLPSDLYHLFRQSALVRPISLHDFTPGCARRHLVGIGQRLRRFHLQAVGGVLRWPLHLRDGLSRRTLSPASGSEPPDGILLDDRRRRRFRRRFCC